MPYKRIASRIGVSASSVHAWTKDIELTEEQESFNLRGPRGPQDPEVVRRRAKRWAAKCRAARLASQEDGRRAARGGDSRHQAGCMLYWAEGGKRRNTIQFTNSDAHMLAFFRRFLVEGMAIERNGIVMAINVYTNNGMTIEEIERYWLDVLELPPRRGDASCTAPGRCSTSTEPFRSTRASTSRPGWIDALTPCTAQGRHNQHRAVSSMAERGTSTQKER
jgi:hypothetical protein